MTIEEIKKAMKKQKITYKILSERSGISENTLKHIFCGDTRNPRLDTIQAIENALNVSFSESASYDQMIVSEDERALLEAYRAMPDGLKPIALNTVRSLAGENSTSAKQNIK